MRDARAAAGAEEGALTLALLCFLAAGLDAELARLMQGRTGAVVVLDTRTGTAIAQHRPDIAKRTFARPGSVIKPFTLQALHADARIACPRTVRIGARKLDCSHPRVAPLDAEAALAYSCNHWFVTNAQRLRPQELFQALSAAGRASLAANSEELALQAVGEAHIQVTPYGLAEAYRSLALRARGAVLHGLEGCVRYGTGQLAAVPGLRIAGKTGTGTTGPGGYSHAWFAGFAPAHDPRVVVVVFLERGQGGADAAPIAGEVFRAWHNQPGYRVRLYWSSRKEGETITLAPEDYVAAVLAGEATVLKSEEALKAMAVAVRTYAHRFAGRHAKEGFDFCDTTHCQDLRLAAVNDRVRRAAAATEGEMLWYDGRPAAAYYHAHCGGTTEDDAAGPYLRSQHDGYCGLSEWRATLSKTDISRALGAREGRFEIAERNASGRARSIRFGGFVIPAGEFHLAIGRALGWNLLRSTFYDARDTGAAVAFSGRGAGHGIGLCQAGAAGMNKPYRDILAYYYPGTSLGRGAQGFRWTRLTAERCEVWTTRPEGSLPALADRAIAEAERRSGIRIERHPQFRFYPTVAAFRDATGAAGSTAAFTSGTTVHLQPPQVLRGAGTLDRTLVHEALHIAIESRARPGLPLWFREGLVAHLTEPDPRTRVGRLVSERGLSAVLDWLRSGLPPDLDGSR